MKMPAFARNLMALTLVVPGATARAAAPIPTEAETMVMLLDEVRGLRRAVEQMGRTNVRLQVTLQRLNLQYQQVRALTDQASGLDAAIAGSASEVERARSQLTELQERMEQETNPDRRRDLEIERRSLHDVIVREAAQEQDLRRRSSDVAQMLAVENGKLNELSDGLADLERPAPASGARRPADPSAEPAGSR